MLNAFKWLTMQIVQMYNLNVKTLATGTIVNVILWFPHPNMFLD